MSPITDIREVTARRLGEILRRGGHLPNGEVSALNIVPIAVPAATSAARFYRLTAGYSGELSPGLPPVFFLKIMTPDCDKAAVSREILFYSQIAADRADLPLVPCYDSECSADAANAHLLLADLSTSHRSGNWSGDQDEQEAVPAVDALARIHVNWWGGHGLDSVTTKIAGRTTSEFLEHGVRKFPVFIEKVGRDIPTRFPALLEKIVSRLPSIWQRRIDENNGLTLIHGDPHPGNFLFPQDSSNRISLIDWQYWSIAPPAVDLSYLLGLYCPPETRNILEEKLFSRYSDIIRQKGVTDYGPDRLRNDYRLALMYNALMPVWSWSVGINPGIWRTQLTNILAAVIDWQASDLLA